MGCPSPILDVPQCSRPCPANCLHCYPNTGVCTQCKDGYVGEKCELGMYFTKLQTIGMQLNFMKILIVIILIDMSSFRFIVFIFAESRYRK